MELDPRLIHMFSRSRGKGELKKAEIVHETIQYIANHGFENLSFEKIASQLDIGKSNVVYHFKSKDDIFLRCFEYIALTAQEIVVQKCVAAEPGLKRLAAYIAGNFEWLELHTDQAKVFLFCYLKASQGGAFAELSKKIRQASLERLMAILKETKEVPDSKLEERAHRVLDLLTGAMVELGILCHYTQKAKVKEKLDLVVKALPSLIR